MKREIESVDKPAQVRWFRCVDCGDIVETSSVAPTCQTGHPMMTMKKFDPTKEQGFDEDIQ